MILSKWVLTPWIQFKFPLPAWKPKNLKHITVIGLSSGGGGCDTQNILGKVGNETLTAHVTEQVKTLYQNGGMIFAAVHDIQPNISGQDIAAIFNTARQVGSKQQWQ